jgi:long-subunit acyl-CoA synthetase (AMP-forming)
MIGPSITRGYYKNPEANAVALNGEWLHTGDIAIIDDKGRIFIVDRLKVNISHTSLTVGIDQIQGKSSCSCRT